MGMNIGPYSVAGRALLAPMAGVTDQPFRILCRRWGAGLATTEMITSQSRLWQSAKTKQRLSYQTEEEPRSVQIVGADPEMLADSAQRCVELGAQIIDINMGCPAKKVCNVAAGSALLQNEKLVSSILESVVGAVAVPVTLKIRTGWNQQNKNAVKIAKIAEFAGIQALTIHGRTRACGFKGSAEFDTIAAVKQNVSIPVIANGDITTPQKAKEVLDYTQADAVMIGRGAQGRPWIFQTVNHFLETGEVLPEPKITIIAKTIEEHLQRLYDFYGEFMGTRIARKHLRWYCQDRPGGEEFWKKVNRLEDSRSQFAVMREFFHELAVEGEKAA